MVVANRDRLTGAVDVLKDGLIPAIETHLKAKLGSDWVERLIKENRGLKRNAEGHLHWDVQALCKVLTGYWNPIFGDILDRNARTYANEIIDIRNRLAHEEPFSSDDTYRALDTFQRMLQLFNAGTNAEMLGKAKQDLQRQVYKEETRARRRKSDPQLTIEGTVPEGLKPWREIVEPHPDVASGNYMQAEFAADLSQVHRGEGSDEYRDPVEFYARTFLTDGIKELIRGAVQRIAGSGGDPIVELQTNFGGGKTHTLLALYHLFSGTDHTQLEGIEELLLENKLPAPVQARRAVLVGTALSPGQISEKSDGTQVRTLWGEMAWQLLGAKGFEIVRDSDEKGVSPGSELLKRLFDEAGPCLILIDEWVAYARQLVQRDDLAAGNFEAQKTFAQAVTEAAKLSPQTLLVASIPASKIELGGEHGERALEILKNVFERVAVPWRPAAGDEGFEIVRRRLFQPITDASAFADRDHVLNEYLAFYKKNPDLFPHEVNSGEYYQKLVQCYPIHPELFRRLYGDWSTLDRFQRTRGVLRLLAKVVHRLWVQDDRSLAILPGSIPMDDGAIRSELTRYLPDVWEPILTRDVDGADSLPLQLDQKYTNLGRHGASRRVARALFIGSAPGSDSDRPGIGQEQVLLGCAQPGDPPGVFADALRRVIDQAVNMHQDGNRYWISTKGNLNRTVEGKVAQYLRQTEDLDAEIQSQLAQEPRSKFPGVHICPVDSSEIPDEMTSRLVILKPEHGHTKGKDATPALMQAAEILEKRGSSARYYRNTLVFMAPDEKELEELRRAMATLMAWKEVLDQHYSLNLDAHQHRLAEEKVEEFKRTVAARIQSTWVFLLVPRQETATSEVEWEESRASGSGSIAERAWTKLQRAEAILPGMGGARLKMALDHHGWFEHAHIEFGELSRWFASYLYLPRVEKPTVLERAIKERSVPRDLTSEAEFATADSYDESREEGERYSGLQIGAAPSNVSDKTLLVRLEVAKAEIAKRVAPPKFEVGAGVRTKAEKKEGRVVRFERTSDDEYSYLVDFGAEKDLVRETELEKRSGGGGGIVPKTKKIAKRCTASVELRPHGIGSQVAQINEELLVHITSLPSAKANIHLEIQVEVPEGIPEELRRVIQENAAALRFQGVYFHES